MLVREGECMIEISQIEKVYTTAKQSMKAVKSMNLTIHEGEVLGIVGESGSGKSTLGKMIIGLEAPTSGTITYQGKSLWQKNKYKRVRPGEIQTVFQDPQSSLDPRMRVKDIIQEPLLALPKSE